jgi:hypothetical protein
MSTNGDAMTTSDLLEGSKLKAAPAARSGLTEAEIKALAKGMMSFLKNTFVPELLEKQIEPLLLTRLRRLDERLKDIEGRALLEDSGIWNSKSDYHPGNCVTHDGSYWVAKTWHRNGMPGTCDDWRLLVKRGRDAKGVPR